MADVFLSYAREDRSFAQELTTALRARNREVWVDLEDIIPSARWMEEIRTGITGADAVAFIITPDSIASEVCRIELDYAVEQSKRLVPIVARQTPAEDIPAVLAELNWLSFPPDGIDFQAGVDRLVEILDTDIDRVHLHTRLLTRTREWEVRDRNRSLLLRGDELKDAETWLADQTGRKPTATPGQAQLILASRRAVTRRLRGTGSAAAVIALVLAVLAAFAFIERQTAIYQRDLAISRQVADEANRVAVNSPQGRDTLLAMQLSLASYRISNTVEARSSLLSSAALHTATKRLGDSPSRTIAISPDGHILASGLADQAVRLYDIRNPKEPVLQSVLTDHTGPINGVAFSPDGRTLASGNTDHTVQLWDLTNLHHPSPEATLSHGDTVNAVAYSPDGRILASGSGDHTIRLWDVTDPHHPSPEATLADHADTVYAVAFSPDGRTLASGDTKNTVQLWDATDPHHPSLEATVTGPTDYINSVAFSPDGHTLLSGGQDGALRLEDVTDPRHPSLEAAITAGHSNTVLTVAFSPDRHTLASSSADHTIRIWDVTDLRHPVPEATLIDHSVAVITVAFSPDGHTLASGSADRTIRLWDLTDPRHPSPEAILTGYGEAVFSVAFSPDGHTLASGSADRTVRIWDVTDPRHPSPEATLTSHSEAVAAVAFSPDGHTLASSSLDRTVRLWSLADPRHPSPEATLTGHGDTVNSVAFSPDGHTLASGSADKTVRLWDTNVDEATTNICSVITTPITATQWQQYIPDLPYSPPCALR